MRLGVLGGTFDPIHIGHLLLAQAVQEALSLDRIILIPAADPPHKKSQPPLAPAEDRLAMVDLAIAGLPTLQSSRLELDRPGKSYTVDTLTALHSQHPHGAIYLIIGADNVTQLSTWHRPHEIFESCTVVAGSRSTPDGHVEAELLDQILTVDTPMIELSSSDIRQRLAAGQSVRYMVPETVEIYLRDRRLYLAP